MSAAPAERRPRVVVVNLNPTATTRSGARKLVRAVQRLAPAAIVSERHFGRLTALRLATLEPRAVLLGPQGVPFDAYPRGSRDQLFDFIRRLHVPTLGVCGGHQALVLAHGGAIAPVMGGAASGTYAGQRKLKGAHVVRLVPDDLTAGLGDTIMTHASHVEGVTRLPSGFRLVGTGTPCRVQMIRLVGAPIWGVQFHPETGRDGHRLLRRFLHLAGVIPPA